jgi:hypothetical protein
MSSEVQSHEDRAHDEQKLQIGERTRGALVMVLGTGALVGIAYAAMTLITAPDGWAMKAANATVSEAIETSPHFAASIEEQQ